MTTTTTLTEEVKLTALKHLANGKPLEVVASIIGSTREAVLDVASHHGYPDTAKLSWAVDVLTKKLEDSAAPPKRAPEPTPRPTTQARPTPRFPVAPVAAPAPADDLETFLRDAKAHPSKRIRTAANRVDDQIARLRDLISEDEEKHAARRKAEKEKAAAVKEVQRLKAELAAAQAKLRPATATTRTPGGDGPNAAVVRAWAAENNVECPSRGRLPDSVRSAYDQAHPDAEAS